MGCKESDTTEYIHTHTRTHIILQLCFHSHRCVRLHRLLEERQSLAEEKTVDQRAMSCLLSLCWSLVMLSLGPRSRLEHSFSSPGALRTVLSCRRPSKSVKLSSAGTGIWPQPRPHTQSPESGRGRREMPQAVTAAKALFPDEVTVWSQGKDAT